MVVRHRTPFAPEFNFIVKRPFILNARKYQVGDEFDKSGVNVRLIQKLYEQHKVDAVIPSFTIQRDTGDDERDAPAPAQKKAARAKAKPRAATPEPEAEMPATEAPVAAGGAPSQYRIEPAFGGVKIVGPAGVVAKYKTKDEAEAALAALPEG